MEFLRGMMQVDIKIPTKKAGSLELPVLGLGTWQIGGRYSKDTSNDARDVAGIKEAIKLGINHIDTAEMYAERHAETLVGKAIRFFPRQKLFITTKVSPEHLHYGDVIRAAKGSMERLGVKQIDLYLIHAPNTSIPLRETMRAMDFLVKQKLVRFIGVSNFDSKLIEQAQSYTENKIVNNQTHYNLAAREFEDNGTIDYCRKNKILVTAYRPLGKGELTKSGNNLIDKLSGKYGKTPSQIALNWLINKPNIVTIVKSTNPDHLRENLGCLGWKLKPADQRELDDDFPRGDTIRGPLKT